MNFIKTSNKKSTINYKELMVDFFNGYKNIGQTELIFLKTQ